LKFITVNPTWNVPPSIIYNEYLPALQQDPTVLQRMGLKLERNRDGTIHNFAAARRGQCARPYPLQLPEQVLVYQHDTPDKNLFPGTSAPSAMAACGAESRSIRSDPAQHHDANASYTPEKIRGMYGHSEIDLKFPTPIPVNITYQTAFVDDGGKLQIRRDIYGRDATMIGLLKNNRNKDLETLVSMPSRTMRARRTLCRPASLRQRQHLFLRTLVL